MFEAPTIEIGSLGDLCLKHCKAACCSDLRIQVDHNETYLFSPNGQEMQKLPTFEEARDFFLLDIPPKGVFVHEGQAGVDLVVISGKCPNLDPKTYRCKIYDNRPKPCRLLKPGSEACVDAHNRMNPRKQFIPIGQIERRTPAVVDKIMDKVFPPAHITLKTAATS
jgi:Fe-S-cluster containining protein